MEESIAITKTVVVGFIIVWSILYRVKTWDTPKLYASIKLNAIVFTSFAVGLILTNSMGISAINKSVTINSAVIFLCAPVALAFYYFSMQREIRISRIILALFAWYVFAMTALDSNNMEMKLALYAGILIFTAYSFGVLNGILGPILPALAIAQFVTLIIWGQGAKALSSDKLASFIQGVIDLGLDFMPPAAKMIVGVLLIVLGLSDAMNFYGLKDFIERITGGGLEN